MSTGFRSFGLDIRAGAQALYEVQLNGAPVATKKPGSATALSLAIQQEVVPGPNQLLLTASVREIPLTASPRTWEGPPPAELFVEIDLESDLVRDLGDSYSIQTNGVETREWRPSESSEPLNLPHVIALKFEAPGNTQPPVWLGAEAIDPASSRAMLELEIAELHRLLAERRLEAFESRMKVRNHDMARAFPFSGSAADRADQDLAELREVLLSDGFELRPLEPQSLAVRAYAGGRLVEMRRSDGSAALQGAIKGQPAIEFPMLFSLVNGSLAVVR